LEIVELLQTKSRGSDGLGLRDQPPPECLQQPEHNRDDTCKQRENCPERYEIEKTVQNELHAPAPPCVSFSTWAASQAKGSVIPAMDQKRPSRLGAGQLRMSASLR